MSLPNLFKFFHDKCPLYINDVFDKSCIDQASTRNSTMNRRATQSLLKIQNSYERFLKERSKAFEARRRCAGGGTGALVSPGGS